MNADIETISVNGKTYYAAAPEKKDQCGPIKIVVLQRGWVLIGEFHRDADRCFLRNASVIRNWGTTKGLGELAIDGPNSNTKLDKCNGVVEFEALTKVLSIDVDQTKWQHKQ